MLPRPGKWQQQLAQELLSHVLAVCTNTAVRHDVRRQLGHQHLVDADQLIDRAAQCTLAYKKLGINPIVMSAGELESGNAGEPAKLVRPLT